VAKPRDAVAMTAVPSASAVAELVRLPAVLTVPGDTLVGAATGGCVLRPPRVAALASASACLYLAGMALNDYADRDVDARERPNRPIPSGRVEPRFALRLAQGLTAAGITLAATEGALKIAVPLAGTVWAYDLLAKNGPAGPLVMAAARSLDVLLGADPGQPAGAVPAAALVGGHTVLVTLLSRYETIGSCRAVPRMALAGTCLLTAAAATLAGTTSRRAPQPNTRGLVAALLLLSGYAGSLLRSHLGAVADPRPATLQRAVGAGVLGVIPLEAALIAAGGQTAVAATLGAAWQLARRLARRRAVT
jgi:4-hydroxybenzoate polyprenyltransferase